ncbi:MAG TPA: hypothetical protein VGE27_17650 [Gemmatimonas sp.]|uniref:hypothetical protein n=1 Tax=Gemmatimonas sp. TaxID=1962908 RepID=UPI002EDAC93F
MSLFATDTSLLAPVMENWTDQTSAESPADAIASLLPQLVADALQRGHVRSAAMTFEQAAALLPFDHPAMQHARELLDRCSAADAAMQQRQLAGEMVVIPSLTERAPGVARFHFGATEAELAHPTVMAFLRAEQDTGAHAELRNFLEQALLHGDHYIDLDPGVGVGVLSARTMSSGRMVAVTADATLQQVIARNAQYLSAEIAELAGATPVQVVSDIADATAMITPQRTVLHLGTLPVSSIAEHAAGWRDHAIAYAWDASDASSAFYVQQELEQLGASSFVMAEDEEGMSLSPFRIGCGATTAFALSERFIETLGGD